MCPVFLGPKKTPFLNFFRGFLIEQFPFTQFLNLILPYPSLKVSFNSNWEFIKFLNSTNNSKICTPLSPPFSFSDLICLGDPSPNFLSLGSPYKYNFQKLHHQEYLQDNHGLPPTKCKNK